MADRQDMWVIIPQGNGGGGGTTNYNSLQNKPKINGVELVGNKTSADLKIEGTTYTEGDGIDITNNEISVNNTIARKSEIPTKTSDLNNDNGFITSADVPTKVSELANDSGFQTQAEVTTIVTNELANFDHLDYEIVTELPTTGEQGVRYLVKHPTDNNFEEYIYVNNAWHDIGSTADVDLSTYYNKTEVDTLLATKQNTLTKADILSILGYEEQTLAITDDNNVTTTRKILVETPAPTHWVNEDVIIQFDNSSLNSIYVATSILETQPNKIRVAYTNVEFTGDSPTPPSDWTAEIEKQPPMTFVYNGGAWDYSFAFGVDKVLLAVRTNDATPITGTYTAHVTIDIVE